MKVLPFWLRNGAAVHLICIFFVEKIIIHGAYLWLFDGDFGGWLGALLLQFLRNLLNLRKSLQERRMCTVLKDIYVTAEYNVLVLAKIAYECCRGLFSETGPDGESVSRELVLARHPVDQQSDGHVDRSHV